ncbi:MAG: site-specific integrase, partial [Raoultibacter sp.]
MRRNISGEGTIVQLEKDKPRSKCRKWKLKVSLGRDTKAEPKLNPKTGKPVYKYITKCRNHEGTYSSAQKALRDFIAELEGGIRLDADKTGVVDYAREFARKRKGIESISDSTCKLDQSFIRLLEHSMGNPNMATLDTQDIDNAILFLQENGGVKGKPLRNSYIIRFRKWLCTLWNKAIIDGVALETPVRDSLCPRDDTEERIPLTVPQLVEAIKILLGMLNKFSIATFIAMFTAIRRGEACALRWIDIDVDDLTIHVRHNLGSNMKLGETKGRRYRDEPMNTWLAVLLLEWEERQIEAAEKIGKKWNKECFVVSIYGEPTNPQRLSEWWRNTSSLLVPEGTHFHDLRHTCITLMARGGADLPTLQGIAGHANIATTQIYLHTNTERKKLAAEGLELMV